MFASTIAKIMEHYIKLDVVCVERNNGGIVYTPKNKRDNNTYMELSLRNGDSYYNIISLIIETDIIIFLQNDGDCNAVTVGDVCGISANCSLYD